MLTVCSAPSTRTVTTSEEGEDLASTVKVRPSGESAGSSTIYAYCPFARTTAIGTTT